MGVHYRDQDAGLHASISGGGGDHIVNFEEHSNEEGGRRPPGKGARPGRGCPATLLQPTTRACPHPPSLGSQKRDPASARLVPAPPASPASPLDPPRPAAHLQSWRVPCRACPTAWPSSTWPLSRRGS